jgi:hypothetical protein
VYYESEPGTADGSGPHDEGWGETHCREHRQVAGAAHTEGGDMSDDNAYREFREAYSDVLADRRLDLPRLARLDRLFGAGPR